MIFAVDTLHQVWGTLPGWLTVVGIVFVGITLWRGGTGTALDTLIATNHVLEDEVKKLRDADRAKDKEIATLQARTDIALALSPLLDWSRTHEIHAQERHVAILNVLDLIAQKLGPDANGHSD